MGEITGIGWTGSTWNPWMGCRSVSPGCHHCYARTLVTNLMGLDFSNVRRTTDRNFAAPARWKEPRLIFTCSISDFFIEEADAWRKEAWEVIRKTPHHTYQVLTKRPERILGNLPEDWGEGYPNVWIGTSVEDQKRADERIPILMGVPAKVRFLSCEPLLESISIAGFLAFANSPKWVIAGGESGPNPRPCSIESLASLRDQCAENKTAFYLKQLGGHPDKRDHERAVLEGKTYTEMPSIKDHP